MKFNIFLLTVTAICFHQAFSQNRKIDTTLMIGKAGYKVSCNNKMPDKNSVMLKPIGFEAGARDINFYVKGKIMRAEIEDFNNDGFPDIVIFATGGEVVTDYVNVVNVYAIASAENKSFTPIYFPDILDDPKLRIGYKGHDEFSLMEGTLLRKFPVYNVGDSTNNPTGGKRIVQYKCFPVEGGGAYKFKVLTTYAVKE